MYPTRKSSGSSGFLNRLQRNSQFATDSASESSGDVGAPDVSPETLLSIIDSRPEGEWTIGSLAAEVSVTAAELVAALDQLRRSDCIRIEGDLEGTATRILLTEIGQKIANYVKITSAR